MHQSLMTDMRSIERWNGGTVKSKHFDITLTSRRPPIRGGVAMLVRAAVAMVMAVVVKDVVAVVRMEEARVKVAEVRGGVAVVKSAVAVVEAVVAQQ